MNPATSPMTNRKMINPNMSGSLWCGDCLGPFSLKHPLGGVDYTPRCVNDDRVVDSSPPAPIRVALIDDYDVVLIGAGGELSTTRSSLTHLGV